MKYKFIGEGKVSLNGVGVVEAGQTIETEIEINHPLFKEVDSKEVKKIINIKPKGGKHE